MTEAPKMIALRWEPGAAVTSGQLMDHPDYTRYVRQAMTHPIEQAADAVERELADLRAKLAQSEADNNGLVELVKATHENNEALRAKLAVAVEVIKALRAEWYLRDLQASDFEAALAQIKGDE